MALDFIQPATLKLHAIFFLHLPLEDTPYQIWKAGWELHQLNNNQSLKYTPAMSVHSQAHLQRFSYDLVIANQANSSLMLQNPRFDSNLSSKSNHETIIKWFIHTPHFRKPPKPQLLTQTPHSSPNGRLQHPPTHEWHHAHTQPLLKVGPLPNSRGILLQTNLGRKLQHIAQCRGLKGNPTPMMDRHPSKNTPTAGNLCHNPLPHLPTHQNPHSDHHQKRKADNLSNTVPLPQQSPDQNPLQSPAPQFSKDNQKEIEIIEAKLFYLNEVLYTINVYYVDEDPANPTELTPWDLDDLNFILGDYPSYNPSKLDLMGKRNRFVTATFWNEANQVSFIKDMEEDKEQSLNLAHWSLFQPLSEVREVSTTQEPIVDNFYRGTFDVNGGPQNIQSSWRQIISRLEMISCIKPETYKLNKLKGILTIYFPSVEDWLKAMKVRAIPKTERKAKELVITPLKHLFHMNDTEWFKVWIGSIPRV